MTAQTVCFKIAGEAGQGINVSALTLAKAFTRKGFHAFLLTENPNSIKLEHNWCSLTVSDTEVCAQAHRVDILVALNKEAILKRQPEVINPGGFLLYDADSIALKEEEKIRGLTYVSVPLTRIVDQLKLSPLLRNTVAVGALLALIDYDIKAMEDILEEQFGRKGGEVVRQNIGAIEAGFKHIADNPPSVKARRLKPPGTKPKMFINGNEALSLAAIKAGCKFLSAYPMTPSSPIMHYLASKEKDYNIVVKHTEDEIAAIHMAIGANYAGVRAMTCTSGGGFALMTEALGMAAQSETPLVVVVGQRPGPSTGQPTHTSQGDLRFLLHASQGEFPRILIAPGDVDDCFRETFHAFNLAEQFQVPVLILTDKYLAESYVSRDALSLEGPQIRRGKLLTQGQLDAVSDYRRYAFTDDGISPRSIPGQKNGLHLATSYEHDEYGYYQEDPVGVTKMMDKRFRKLAAIKAALKRPELWGPAQADITIVAWGSTKGPVLEAMQMLQADKIRVNFLHLVYLWPFPSEAVAKVLKGAKATVGIEGNKTGQMIGLIKEQTGLGLDHAFLQYNGQPFYPVDIYTKVKELLA
ncbi:MAG TPA: 2-oxoacid:acceptor oxidoreductase subunit alpha [Patescibacteria group bacterium]|nr:2-oxoacid:acceptor oxidoreductase subunit alpha [Patescibacteria group bacterium]